MTAAVPWFATIAKAKTAPRPLAAALPVDARAPATSPWSPKPEPTAAAAVVGEPDPAVAQVREQAIAQAREHGLAQGRADGERETAALRAKLVDLIARIERDRADHAAQQAEAIAEAATAVVEAWAGAIERPLVFAPIVRGWIARAHGEHATARVHPDDVAAMTAAIGDAAIAVEPDPALAPGDVCIRNAALDATHVWRECLGELRSQIAAALEDCE